VIQLDESDLGLVITNDDIPPANLHRKGIGLTIPGGPTGRGGVCMQLLIGGKNGVHYMFLAEEGNYMGYVET
jgi:hypothetical protein